MGWPGSFSSFVTLSRQEFYKPKVSVNLDGWPLEFEWLQGQTFDAGAHASRERRQEEGGWTSAWRL